MQPLVDDQIAAYLHAQPELLNAIMTDTALREVAGTPLLLSIFGFVYQGMTDAERAELANLKRSGDIRDKIFNAYIDERYIHEERKLALRHEIMVFTLDELRTILTRLAWHNLTDGGATANVITLYDLVQNVDLEQVEQRRIEAFIELATRLNLLVVGSEDRPGRPTYRFIHLLLRDMLAFPQAIDALHDTNWSVRQRAANALGQIGDARALDGLLIALRDASEFVRLSAIEALRQIGDAHALDGLRSALHDTNEYVGSRALEALRQIGDARIQKILLTPARCTQYR